MYVYAISSQTILQEQGRLHTPSSRWLQYALSAKVNELVAASTAAEEAAARHRQRRRLRTSVSQTKRVQSGGGLRLRSERHVANVSSSRARKTHLRGKAEAGEAGRARAGAAREPGKD